MQIGCFTSGWQVYTRMKMQAKNILQLLIHIACHRFLSDELDGFYLNETRFNALNFITGSLLWPLYLPFSNIRSISEQNILSDSTLPNFARFRNGLSL